MLANGNTYIKWISNNLLKPSIHIVCFHRHLIFPSVLSKFHSLPLASESLQIFSFLDHSKSTKRGFDCCFGMFLLPMCCCRRHHYCIVYRNCTIFIINHFCSVVTDTLHTHILHQQRVRSQLVKRTHLNACGNLPLFDRFPRITMDFLSSKKCL